MHSVWPFTSLASMALCSSESGLYSSVLLIFLHVWEGFSCLLSDTWQHDEAFALGNVEKPSPKTYSWGFCSLSEHFQVMDGQLSSARFQPFSPNMFFVLFSNSVFFSS
ncbi:hypothetical protein AMECASPLE_018538 [Ameca splendens]|uniref:Secreted protein n=1 Tax=Ameca splendens TaxID=208324 RepID=A0ABV0XFS8_9TELE